MKSTMGAIIPLVLFAIGQTTACRRNGMPYPYDEVLRNSILFYEAQRSGDLPSNNRVNWRHDSTLTDGKDVGLDLTGGWFNDGGYVKYGLPMAQSATTLAWGAIEFKDAYVEAGQMEWMLDSLKWATDYFIKCHNTQNELYVQVGYDDNLYWGQPEDIDLDRPSWKVDASHPGSDVAGETAAALAASSIVFRDTDKAYASSLLRHAKELFDFAERYRGIYSDSISDAASHYRSSGYGDELAWAAAWLHLADETDTSYLDKAKTYYGKYGLDRVAFSFDWDNKEAGVQMLLYSITGDDSYASHIKATLDKWLPENGVSYTPKGLAFLYEQGPNRDSANMALLALIAAKNELKPDSYRKFAMSQINYMLGDGGRSFVVGFGNNPPTAPKHASSSCPDSPAPCGLKEFQTDGPNRHILYGALVSGPDINDDFEDNRNGYKNKVTCDYNAGFQSAVAGVYEMYLKGNVPK